MKKLMGVHDGFSLNPSGMRPTLGGVVFKLAFGLALEGHGLQLLETRNSGGDPLAAAIRVHSRAFEVFLPQQDESTPRDRLCAGHAARHGCHHRRQDQMRLR
ncbi:MAG: hypothetical protein HS113_08440 [Verrucomicrobiales bacterium]|nr:hypothetical protein [Verrucomicrobiales bacterium]